MHLVVRIFGWHQLLWSAILVGAVGSTIGIGPTSGDLPRVPATTAARADYVVHAGDELEVYVWREAALSAEVQVRLDGKITVRLIGDVPAAGRSTMVIADEIERRMARFIAAPEVTVTLVRANGSRYYVVGNVVSIGVYPLIGETTVVQALAMAGGFSPFAKRDRIIIIHDRPGPANYSRVDYRRLEKGDTATNYQLRPGDTIVVP